jgi:predicted nucleotidyltransferase
MRHDERVKLREGLVVEDAFLQEFATRHGISRLALYGSALRDDFGSSSDLDILVEFLPGRTPGLLHLAHMELELESVIGRQVELRTYEDLSPYFRDRVVATARPLYAA